MHSQSPLPEINELIIKAILAELDFVETKFGPFNSSHEGYGVLLEEVDELWDVIKLNPKKIKINDMGYDDIETLQKEERLHMMENEAIQIATMAILFIKSLSYFKT